MTGQWVYTVHSARAEEVGVVEVIFGSLPDATRYAKSRSNDPGILASSVCEFLVGQLGARSTRAWFVQGVEQPPRGTRPGRMYPAAPA